MAHPLHHAESSVRRFGGVPEDYLAIHSWFDATKAHLGLFTHRALRHHTLGIFEAEERFGVAIVNSDERAVPVRFIGEQHVKEDCGGRVPTVADWLATITPAPWMGRGNLLDDAPVGDIDPVVTWREEVGAGRTILGLRDWIERHGFPLDPSSP